jgi:4-amino-4-deoxy-L-arabinose transferase-like glycosyltransferase
MRARTGSVLGVILPLLSLTVLLTVPSLFTRDLWNPDEPRYAEVAREMRVLSDWIVPHLNGTIYAEKPPLFFWLSAGFQSAGLGVASGRIVVALFFLGTLLLVKEIGRLLFDERTGHLAAVVLSTGMLFLWVGKAGVLDVPLTFFTTLSLYGLVRHRVGAPYAIVLFYAGMGLGTLVKGPVAILIPCLAALSLRLVAGRGAPKSRATWIWGVPLLAAIVLAWLVPALIQGGDAYRETVLFKQNVGRAVSSWSHRQPIYYYLVRLPGDLFPWSFLLPAACLWARREANERKRREAQALLVWAGLGLLVFSLISGKRERYLLPFHPAACLAVAAYLRAVLSGARNAPGALPLGLLGAIHACFAVLAGALAAIALAGDRLLALARKEDARLVAEALLGTGPRIGAALAAVAILAAAAVGLILVRRRKPGGAVQATLVAAVSFSLAFDLVLVPAFDVVKSPRPVSETIMELVPEGAGEVALYPESFSGAYNLYTGRLSMPVLSGAPEIEEFLAGPGPRAVLTTEERYERDLRGLRVPHEAVRAGFVGHRRMLLVLPRRI